MTKEEVKTIVAKYLAEEVFGNEIDLTNDLPLLSSRLLDSISSMQLVYFLEDTFSIKFKAFEISEKYLNTINQIAEIIYNKTNDK